MKKRGHTVVLAVSILVGIVAGIWMAQRAPVRVTTPPPRDQSIDSAPRSDTSPAVPAATTPQDAAGATQDDAYLALAQSGRPAEVDMLIAHIERETDPERKVWLRQVLSSISNHATTAHLITRLIHTADEDVARGLQQSLGLMADQAVIKQVIESYETAPEDAATRLAGIVDRIAGETSLPLLAEVINAAGVGIYDRLSLAAARALSRVGSPFAAAALARPVPQPTAD